MPPPVWDLFRTGDSRSWNRNGRCSPDIVEFGEEAWNMQGVKVLGTPVGLAESKQKLCDRTVGRTESAGCWEAVPDCSCV